MNELSIKKYSDLNLEDMISSYDGVQGTVLVELINGSENLFKLLDESNYSINQKIDEILNGIEEEKLISFYDENHKALLENANSYSKSKDYIHTGCYLVYEANLAENLSEKEFYKLAKTYLADILNKETKNLNVIKATLKIALNDFIRTIQGGLKKLERDIAFVKN